MLIVKAGPYYVYLLIDPRTGVAFYVGKGKGDRARQHVKEWKRGGPGNARKFARIVEIVRDGLEVQITIAADNLNEIEAYRIERKFIAEMREANADLTNIAPGRPCPLQRNYYVANDLLSRVKTPNAFWRGKLISDGCEPTEEEWDLYWFVLGGLAKNRSYARRDMRLHYGEEVAAGGKA